MAQTGRVFQFKLVLLGDSAVGKSSLVLRFVRGQFFEYQESTIGAAFLTQTVALNDTTVKFEIWDTAGQERYHSLAPMYYRGAAAAIVVYDITNRVRGRRALPHRRQCHSAAARRRASACVREKGENSSRAALGWGAVAGHALSRTHCTTTHPTASSNLRAPGCSVGRIRSSVLSSG